MDEVRLMKANNEGLVNKDLSRLRNFWVSQLAKHNSHDLMNPGT